MHPPEAEQECNFLRKFVIFGRLERLFRQCWRVLRVTTKKVVNFGEEKCTPRQNPGYAYAPPPKFSPRVQPLHSLATLMLKTAVNWQVTTATSNSDSLLKP